MKSIKALYRIFAVPLFQDNYSYILQTNPSDPLFLIDPANPQVILECLLKYFPQNQVGYILYTHKHWDHAGGAEELQNALNSPKLKIISGKNDAEHIKTVNKAIHDDCQLDLKECNLGVFNVPCHTRGHVIYHFKERFEENKENFGQISQDMMTSEGKLIRSFRSEQCAFTGDTLFSGGIGRFFQGNASEMYDNLKKITTNIHSKCDIYNGHEYTLPNLKWGIQVQQENKKIQEYIKYAEKESCTLPTSLEKESEVNVFLRAYTGSPIRTKLGLNGVQYLRLLRQAKNKNSSNLVDFLK